MTTQLNTAAISASTDFDVVARCSDDDILARAAQILEQRAFRYDQPVTGSEIAHKVCAARLAHLDHEQFIVIYLDNQHAIIDTVEHGAGTIDGCAVYPREVAKTALLRGAAAVILAHNHPSGRVEPSEADKAITKRLSEALALLDIRTLDHIIIGGGNGASYSFSSNGLM